jgi:hypothetical protein
MLSCKDSTWPRNKAEWVRELAAFLAVPSGRAAAVGDSTRDLPMLRGALRYFVGSRSLPGLNCIHVPDGNVEDVAKRILTRWSLGSDPVTPPKL